MYRGSLVLIIIIQRRIHPLKMGKVQGPQRPRTIVLIKNALRKIQPVFLYDISAVYLDHHAARAQQKLFMLLLIQYPRLVCSVVLHHFSHFKAPFGNQAVVTPHHVRPGLPGPGKKPFIIVRGHPVVAVNKTDPFSRCPGKPQIFCAPLSLVDAGGHNLELVRVPLFILP